MFLFNEVQRDTGDRFYDLNTSYVSIQCHRERKGRQKKTYLNTSYVSIQSNFVFVLLEHKGI